MNEPVPRDRNGLEILCRDECLLLLATATIGRIGVSIEALPVVLPINFRLVGERIVFCTGEGTKLDAATANAVVSFEVDDFDAFWHTGWSVVVTGTATDATDTEEVAALADRVARWAPQGGGRVVAIDPIRISGRRIT